MPQVSFQDRRFSWVSLWQKCQFSDRQLIYYLELVDGDERLSLVRWLELACNFLANSLLCRLTDIASTKQRQTEVRKTVPLRQNELVRKLP